MFEVQKENLVRGSQLMGQLIYVVEDEADIAELISFNLRMQGFRVQCFQNAELAWSALMIEQPDMMLLDIMLPGTMTGLDICRKVKGKKEFKNMPIMMLSAKGEENDIVRGLENGADDYMTKPFSPQVLKARVNALFRRYSDEASVPVDENIIEYNGLFLHLGRHEVKVLDELIDLTQSEFKILHYLAKRPGWVYTRGQIVEAIRGDNYAVTDRSIDFQMVGLRKKLGQLGHYIETVRGVGYRFKE